MTDVHITATVEINDAEWEKLAAGDDLRDLLEQIGGAITPRAIAKTGRRTGRLRANMGHAIIEDEDGVVIQFGAGVAPGTEPVDYDVPHWAPGKPGGPRASWPGTRPWTETLRELGIEYEQNRGYPV